MIQGRVVIYDIRIINGIRIINNLRIINDVRIMNDIRRNYIASNEIISKKRFK